MNFIKRTISLSSISLFLIIMVLGCKKQPVAAEFDKNFVHSVYVWLKEPNNQSDRMVFENSLQKLFDNSKYTKTNYLGIPANTPRKVVDNSYTYLIVVTFTSKEEQDLYQTEAAHQEFLKEASSLWSKVLIYDAIEVK